MNLRSSILVLAFACLLASHTPAASILLKDGRTLEGKVVEVSGVAEDPTRPKVPSGEIAVTPILMVYDGLRRTYIHKSQISQLLEKSDSRNVRIKIWQHVAERGSPIAHVGRGNRVDSFDKYGRRIYELVGPDGPIRVVQGITEITPVYTRVRGLQTDPRSYVWDMRIATSSIPRDILSEILANAVTQDDPDSRLQVVKLYLQSGRYRDARLELEQVIEDFPQMEDRAQEVRQLRQMGARVILEELKMWDKAGQHTRVRQLLHHFPAEEIAGETLQEVRELIASYEAGASRRQSLLERLQIYVTQIPDELHQELAIEFVKEIETGLGEGTVDRLNSFERLSEDESLDAEQKVALAISGWLVGSNQATDNFAIALSLAEVRDGVRAYLRSETAVERTQILAELRDMEGGSVERVAELLRRMAPPLDVPAEANIGPGYYQLTTAGISGEDDVTYYVQLPPEYNPLRNYPALVVLTGERYPAEQYLNFWAGEPRSESGRAGQAMRHGYITIAVDWQKPNQSRYGYTAREHHAVLSSFRNALRYFSIDSDRVFLAGHGIGGDAAWDIALAHPDQWAGVMPILAVADRYCPRYWKNAEYVSWYFVAGEKDSDKIARNSREFDRYLRPKFDMTLVEYQGRGFEPLGDEIQNMFDWMGRRQRSDVPAEFECASMRPWDNYFWWLEVDGLPEKTMVEPAQWPVRSARPARVRGKIYEQNKVAVFANCDRAVVWLTPELVDFQEPIMVEVNGRRIVGRGKFVEPQLAVLLEDARTRGDRRRPYWAKVESE